jgi:hypothetical protein
VQLDDRFNASVDPELDMEWIFKGSNSYDENQSEASGHAAQSFGTAKETNNTALGPAEYCPGYVSKEAPAPARVHPAALAASPLAAIVEDILSCSDCSDPATCTQMDSMNSKATLSSDASESRSNQMADVARSSQSEDTAVRAPTKPRRLVIDTSRSVINVVQSKPEETKETAKRSVSDALESPAKTILDPVATQSDVSQPPAKQTHAKAASQTPATTQINATKKANEAEKSKSGHHVHTPKQVNTDTNPQKKASAKAQNYTNAKHKQKQKQRKGLSKQYMKQVEEQQRQLDEGIVVTKTLLGTCSVVEPGGNTRPYYSVEHQATHMPVTVSSYEVDVDAVVVPAVRRVLELLPVGFGCKGGVARQLLKLGPAQLAPDHTLVAAEIKSESTSESDVDLVVIAADSGSPRRHVAAADSGSPRSTRDSVLGVPL